MDFVLGGRERKRERAVAKTNIMAFSVKDGDGREFCARGRSERRDGKECPRNDMLCYNHRLC